MAIMDLAPPQIAGGTLATSLVAGWVGHLWGYVPGFVAVTGGCLAIVWYCLMIWESETLKDWRSTRAARRKLRRIAYLQVEQRIASAELAELDPSAMVTAAEMLAATPVKPSVHEEQSDPPGGSPPVALMPPSDDDDKGG